MSREITIAGGGLAGLGVAIGLRIRGVPVTVLEASNYPRHRVCGEFISGTAEETLDLLGIKDLLADASRHRTVSWHHAGRPFYHGELSEPALGISRRLLDSRLAERLVSAGGVLKTGIRAKAEPEEGHVWAAGKKPAGGPWIGLKAHLRLPLSSDLEMHLGTNGYLGLAGVEDGWTNACGLFRTDRSIKEIGTALIAAYLAKGGQHHLGERIAAAECREGSTCTIAGFRFGSQPVQNGIFALGDSSHLIPPFTGNGMSMALQTAGIALDPLESWSRGTISWDDALRDSDTTARKKFRVRMTASAAIHPVLMSPIGQWLASQLGHRGMLPFHLLLPLFR